MFTDLSSTKSNMLVVFQGDVPEGFDEAVLELIEDSFPLTKEELMGIDEDTVDVVTGSLLDICMIAADEQGIDLEDEDSLQLAVTSVVKLPNSRFLGTVICVDPNAEDETESDEDDWE